MQAHHKGKCFVDLSINFYNNDKHCSNRRLQYGGYHISSLCTLFGFIPPTNKPSCVLISPFITSTHHRGLTIFKYRHNRSRSVSSTPTSTFALVDYKPNNPHTFCNLQAHNARHKLTLQSQIFFTYRTHRRRITYLIPTIPRHCFSVH